MAKAELIVNFSGRRASKVSHLVMSACVVNSTTLSVLDFS